jgi:hypothetical protein
MEELVRLIHAYLMAGLDAHEGCLWILPPLLAPIAATTSLQRTIPLVHDYLRTGQLELIPCCDWYHPQAALDADRIVARCAEKLRQGASRFAGLRVTGDASWVTSAKERAQFIAYERCVQEAATSMNVLALCTYPGAAWGPADTVTVLEAHSAVLIPDSDGWQAVPVHPA